MSAVSQTNSHGGAHYLQGIAIMACGVLPLPIMDATGKYLATVGSMAPGQVAFYRFFFQFLLTLPVLLYIGGLVALRPNRWWPNLLRGAFLSGASLGIFTAVKFMPLAAVIAIFFVEPFILTALSAVVLKEKVDWPRWLAIVIGFIGAIIVINPSFNQYGFVAVLPVISAALFAGYMLMNRLLGRHDSPLTMQFVAGIGGSILLAMTLVGGTFAGLDTFELSLPISPFSWALVLCLGAIGAYSHMIIVYAFQKVPASVLAPFQYLEIISATILGYILFNDFPTPSKILGIAIIVISGLFVVWREKRAS